MKWGKQMELTLPRDMQLFFCLIRHTPGGEELWKASHEATSAMSQAYEIVEQTRDKSRLATDHGRQILHMDVAHFLSSGLSMRRTTMPLSAHFASASDEIVTLGDHRAGPLNAHFESPSDEIVTPSNDPALPLIAPSWHAAAMSIVDYMSFVTVPFLWSKRQIWCDEYATAFNLTDWLDWRGDGEELMQYVASVSMTELWDRFILKAACLELPKVDVYQFGAKLDTEMASVALMLRQEGGEIIFSSENRSDQNANGGTDETEHRGQFKIPALLRAFLKAPSGLTMLQLRDQIWEGDGLIDEKTIRSTLTRFRRHVLWLIGKHNIDPLVKGERCDKTTWALKPNVREALNKL